MAKIACAINLSIKQSHKPPSELSMNIFSLAEKNYLDKIHHNAVIKI